MSGVKFNASKIFFISLAFETFSMSSETTRGNDVIFSRMWPRDFMICFEEVAAIAEQSANLFSFLFKPQEMVSVGVVPENDDINFEKIDSSIKKAEDQGPGCTNRIMIEFP